MKIVRYLRNFIIFLSICFLLVMIGGSSMGSYAYYLADWDNAFLVAHRGGASFAPENTCAALRQAIDAGLPMAEIDVQLTKDGVVIVMHDSSFLRTTGFNRRVADTDSEIVRMLDAGLYFSQYYAGEPVPVLEDMLALARDHIILMIELKSGSQDQLLVESVLELINLYGMEDQCLIASMNLDMLQMSKTLAPEMDTVFITSQSLSDAPDLSFVDSYSVKSSALTHNVVEKVHLEGKTVYAWTVNNRKTALKMLAMEVDGIITDDLWLDSK